MKSIIAWFVRNPVAANLLMAAMVVMGITGYLNLQREFLPRTTANGINVSVSWPGASPRDVKEQLVVRIEEAVDGLDGIDSIDSSIREGVGTVTVNAKTGTDFEKLVDQVNAKVDSIRNLPVDSFRPEVTRAEFRVDVMYLALHGDVDYLTLQREADNVRDKLSQIPGLQLTNHITKVSEQVTIEVNEENLRRYNLTFNQVAAAIRNSSVNLSAGSVQTSAGELQLRARSLASDAAEFSKIIIRQTPDGSVLHLRDIAVIKDSFVDDDISSRFSNQNAAVFQVLSPDRMDITAMGKSVRQFEKDIQSSLPDGMTFSLLFDGSEIFDSRLGLIGSNAVSGLILVLIILILFLHPSVAIWVTVGIAAAFFGAIGVAPYMGITLNLLSLFAFLLVIGIVVDDAIVVGESIHLHVENGIKGNAAAIGGANMVVKPVYFAVITTIMMFLPFLFMSGSMRDFLAQISLVVIAVLSFSLIEAFFVLPAHLRHLKHESAKPKGKFMRFQSKLAGSLVTFAQNRFRPIVGTVIRLRYVTLASFIGLMILSVGVLKSGIAPTAFVPEVEGDMIEYKVRFPEGTSFERMNNVVGQVERGVEKLNSNTEADFDFDQDLITGATLNIGGNVIQGFIALRGAEDRNNLTTKAISDKFEEYIGPIPDALRVTVNTGAGPPTGGGNLRFGIASNDPVALKAAVLDLKDELETLPATTRTWDSLESSAQELQFTLKPGAQTLGVTLNDVTRQVRQAFFGLEVQRLPRDGEDVRVMVRYPEAARESIDSLQSLRIRAANGVEVPLYSVANVEIADGVARISRRDRKTVEYVGALIKGKASQAGLARKDLEANFFPEWEKRHPEVTRISVGDADIEADFKREMSFSGMVVLILMYGLLAIAFKSYAQPLLIMIAIPFAFVGMVFGHALTQVPFGMMSVFGFFAAAGVAVNDNLVLIDYVNRLRAQGVGAYQAMMDACVSRFRPILLTSVTTFFGIMPILFETSVQAQFLKPMVVALAFGVLFDFFLTLILVPALYGIGVDIRRGFLSAWTGVKQPKLGSNYDPELALALDDMEFIPSVNEGSAQPAE